MKAIAVLIWLNLAIVAQVIGGVWMLMDWLVFGGLFVWLCYVQFDSLRLVLKTLWTMARR